MSVGGGGLCFLIRVPTVECERDLYDSRLRSTSETEIVSSNGNRTPSIHISSSEELNKTDETEVKTKVPEPLEKVLKKSLEELRILDSLWVLDKDEKFYQVTFTCNAGLPCDLILTSLATNGIGMCRGSSLMVLPCTVWLQEEDESTQGSQENEQKLQLLTEEDGKSESDSSTLSKTKSEVKKAFRNFKDMQKKFLQTVTARLTVAQVVDGVRAGAEPTFDFIMFVLIASMVSALGLLENSSVVIVASMLISPIMGPIMAGTFGAVIRDRSLRNLGIKTEIFGLLLCVFIGFTFGLLSEVLNAVWGHKEWPNPEMVSRGQERSLWVGVLIALPSGAGVALSVLGGNAASLVGVAISASLLPPAVNAGLLWGMATVRTLRAQEEALEFVRYDGALRLLKPSLRPPVGYQTNYYIEMDSECALLGLVSLALALVNIACIFVAAVIVLKIKEVAPRTSMAKTSRFWKEDIRIARDYNTTMPAAESDELGEQFLAEWATLNGLEPEAILSDDAEAALTRMETLKDIMEDVESDDVFQRISRSVGNKADTRPLTQRFSMISVPPNLTTEARNERSRSMFHTNIKRTVSLMVPETRSSNSSTFDSSVLKDVELRRPKVHLSQSFSSHRRPPRSSVAVLRQSLVNADSPYTLWPPSSNTVGTKARFQVTPVPEEQLLSAPTSPTRRRVSKFLLDPCVVIKETTC
ncbi:hypothetical protein JTE90_011712 [Oedothorax gibbosus]|uniref:Uncharacterized protein n=1 Tax=Oedothorax gibbosus TaxID=931172 RepID=A0AAV6US98_9ARAC|nr:hypothetical protein JTE90_011712 [Oedothorax gibbosus]